MTTEKLIDANEVKKKLRDVKKWFDGFPCNEQDKLAQAVAKMCIEEVEKIKPVDAVRVVRCKDCSRAQEDKMFGGLWCYGKRVNGNYFCANGEKRTEEGK